MNTALSRVAALAVAALIALAAVITAPTPALAHDELINTEVLPGSEGASPEGIRLTFSNSILDAGTEIVVTAPDGADATNGEPELDGPLVTQALAPDLADGEYQVTWRVVSSDGHPIDGAFSFAFAANTPATIGDATTTDNPGAEENDASSPEDTETPADNPAAVDAEGANPGLVVLFVLVGIAVIGAVIAIVVGQRRRARAIEEAAQQRTDDDA